MSKKIQELINEVQKKLRARKRTEVQIQNSGTDSGSRVILRKIPSGWFGNPDQCSGKMGGPFDDE